MPKLLDPSTIAEGRDIDGHPKAIAFDCYDTLLTITDIRRPFQQLAGLAGGQLNPSPMTVPISLGDVVERNLPEIMLEADMLEKLEEDLRHELASVQPLPGALEVLQRLRELGYRLAVASNLALPYAAPLRQWLESLVDVEVLSFDVGAAKPSALFYEELCERLDLAPSEVLMVGNSLQNDVVGAKTAGLQARHVRVGTAIEDVVRDFVRG